MNRILFLIFIFLPINSFGQIENKWQPDSIYANRQVKKKFVYLNSPKDLFEVVEFDRTGKRVRSVEYSVSYDRKTRKSKVVEKIYQFEYDTQNRLVKIIDSIGKDSTTFKYGINGNLTSSQKKVGNFIFETKYSYHPFTSITTSRRDTVVVYEKKKEYDNEFYVKRFFGYVLEPKLKESNVMYFNKDSVITDEKLSYSDYNDLERFDENKVIKNRFDNNNRLIESEVKSVFLNDRVNEYNLYYDYHKNGLLKSIRGYVPRYYKYEYWK